MEDLKRYGILARRYSNFDIQEAKIEIFYATIESIDFDVLQEKGIKELTIGFSKILNIKFSNQNDVKIVFLKCNFLDQVFAFNRNFEKEVEFIGCNFEKEVDFNRVTFQDKVSFNEATFQDKVSFFKAQFLAKQEDNEIIENSFKEIIFEKKTSFSNAIFQARVNFNLSKFKDEVRFIKAQFLAKQEDNEIIENSFKEIIFEKKTSFSNAIFQARVNFNLSKFKDEVRFIKAQFLAKREDNKIINSFRETFFENKVFFKKTTFQARVNFYLSKFKDEVRFIDTVFKDNDFIFKDIEFYHAEFISNKKSTEQKYHFKNVIFKDVTSFKNLNIGELNFENVIFNNIVVFKDVDFVLNDKSKINKPNFINCTFSNQFNIEHKYIQYDFDEIKAKINSDTEKNYKNLLNYRDLFRKLKSNRIAHHNQIDASELRTQELYARELELEHKKDKSLKEKIERWQLIFYHQLCDHHTDILKSFNSLLIIIGIFSILSFFIILGFDYFFGFKVSIEGSLYQLLKFYNENIESLIKDHSISIFFTNFVILSLYMALLFLCIKFKIMRNIFIALSYASIVIIMGISPKIILPVMGIFTDKRVLFDPLSVIGGFYTLMFGFVAYSFIKTIRKNSIVPS
ncbi:hypothetical protein CQA75_00945 [Campylobacter taeniopygiae]|uniref:Pentapeptide repeat-containing protein n=1 Tax=Campylobacter taeniopygiae TaxID=2510188 RepID=A0ABY2TLN8_9BACT|nr:hypothetical protein CQA75_00945 [Campylobacter taeniopygiae]